MVGLELPLSPVGVVDGVGALMCGVGILNSGGNVVSAVV